MGAGLKERAKLRICVLIFSMTFVGEVVYVVYKICVWYGVWDGSTGVGDGVDCWM